MSGPPHETLLQTRSLSKAYPGVQALSEVSLDVGVGEVHALVGENGAGKSTFARLVAGIEPPDSGTMTFRGRPYAPAGKKEAERAGVQIVMQELNLIPTLSVAENIFLHDMPARCGVVDYQRMNAAAAGLLAEVGLPDVPPRQPVGSLGVGPQQLVEIAAGLSQQCALLVLDEPTAALTESEIERLFDQIERLTHGGVGIIYISHRMEEIQRVADRISVLRNGELVATCHAAEADIDRVIRWMVGRDFDAVHPPTDRRPGDVVLRVEGLGRGRAVRDVSFELRAGEVLGFAGLMGSGRTETMRAVFGADVPDSGTVYLRGSDRPTRIRSPRDAVRHGIALLTENRKEQGLLLPLSVRVNATLATLKQLALPGGWVPRHRERTVTERLIELLDIRCRSTKQRAENLSGGNQQKLVIARWLQCNCDVLLFDEPTRGIDVGAKFEIYRLLNDLAAEGKGIVMVSSDLKELMAVCDRIAVMSAGRLVKTFRRGEWDQESVMAAALSEYRGVAREAAAR